MLFALIYIDGILQPAKRLLVQFPCLSFYKYIFLVLVKITYNTLLLLILLIDLIYFSMRPRLLGAGILLVVIETPPKHGQINSNQIVNLVFFRRPLIRLI